MIRFVSSKSKAYLNREYYKLYPRDINKKWLKRVRQCPELQSALMPGITPKELLTADFKKLVDVYLYYVNYCDGLTDAKRDLVKAKAKEVFSYDSYASKIADFLLNPSNGFEIYNCVYCDAEPAKPFRSRGGHKIRRFETEHVLDKGTCPLVALSLYNFVPGGDVCNGTAVKGTKTIGDTPEEIKHLSPTNPSYDFYHKVLFVVNPKGSDFVDIKRTDHPEHYEIDFYYKDRTYEKSVILFGLKGLYNEDYLLNSLRLLDKLDRYPKKMMDDVSNLMVAIKDEEFLESFDIDIARRSHEPYLKIREDLLGLTVLT